MKTVFFGTPEIAVPALEALSGAGVFYGGPAAVAHAFTGRDVFVAGTTTRRGSRAITTASPSWWGMPARHAPAVPNTVSPCWGRAGRLASPLSTTSASGQPHSL